MEFAYDLLECCHREKYASKFFKYGLHTDYLLFINNNLSKLLGHTQ